MYNWDHSLSLNAWSLWLQIHSFSNFDGKFWIGNIALQFYNPTEKNLFENKWGKHNFQKNFLHMACSAK